MGNLSRPKHALNQLCDVTPRREHPGEPFRPTSILVFEDLDQVAEHKDHHADPDVDGESLSVGTEHLGCERGQRYGRERQQAVFER